jgi:signal peptide peptidase-like protein 2B
MGVSVCVCFLCAIRLPNLKVAATLLLLAFFYDIFFVFISPYFFESSVMVAVAEGPTVDTHDDENYCKFPHIPCQLTVPVCKSCAFI